MTSSMADTAAPSDGLSRKQQRKQAKAAWLALRKEQRQREARDEGVHRRKSRNERKRRQEDAGPVESVDVTYEPCQLAQAQAQRSCCTTQCVMRTVAPYVYRFRAFAKERWCGLSLLQLFYEHFEGFSQEYYEQAIAAGTIRVNDAVQAPSYVIKNGDMVEHVTHRHEPPVHMHCAQVDMRSLISYEDSEVIVVNKPGSLPVHPSGAYRHNSLTFVLERELQLPDLHPVHRLDRLTSGLLILSKSAKGATGLAEEIAAGHVRKRYVARVRGEFPSIDSSRSHPRMSPTVDADGVVFWKVDAPIACVSARDKTRGVCTASGKPAETLLRSLGFDQIANETVVECVPLTGRTHQIRVHLQHVGFPIANDPQYDESTSLQTNDKEGSLARSREVLQVAEATETEMSTTRTSSLCEALCQTRRNGDASSFSWTQRECFGLWLHAFQYTSSKWSYKVPLPAWASTAPSSSILTQ